MDLRPVPGRSTEPFKQSVAVCAPSGSITHAGWTRLYLVTSDENLVTCDKCLRRMVMS